MSSTGDSDNEDLLEEIEMAPIYKKRSDLGVLLSEACKADNIEKIQDLIMKFKTDIHQIIYFPYAGKMTPMTFFVKNNKYDAVKFLTSCGAKINTIRIPGSTLLHIACQYADLNIVEYLVENGADLKALDSSNKTCLMVSLGNRKICEYLISHGKNVNDVDKDGQTALHHAVKQSYRESTEVLISSGADVNIKDRDGVDSFHLAAICNNKGIMEYFIQNTNVPSSSIADGYCLLEAECLCKNDLKTATELLNKAVSVKRSEEWKKGDEPKICERLAFGKEITRAEELSSLSPHRELMTTQAFLIYERILGGHHTKTATCLRMLYKIVMKNHELSKGSDILHYIYVECLKKKSPFCYDCILSYQQLIKHTFSLPLHVIETCKILELFTNLVTHIEIANRCLQRWSREEIQNFDRLIVDTVGVLITLSNLIKEKASRDLFHKEVNKLIKIDPRGMNNVTVLHTLLNYDWKSLGFTLAEPQNTTGLIKTLLECGASVNATDDKRNTPLHTVLMCHGNIFTERLPDQDDVVNCLVECGTHMDALNSRDQTVLSLMKGGGYEICSVEHQTLQCLAASVIMNNAVPYQGTVSKSMIPFIKMHGKLDSSVKRDRLDWF